MSENCKNGFKPILTMCKIKHCICYSKTKMGVVGNHIGTSILKVKYLLQTIYLEIWFNFKFCIKCNKYSIIVKLVLSNFYIVFFKCFYFLFDNRWNRLLSKFTSTKWVFVKHVIHVWNKSKTELYKLYILTSEMGKYKQSGIYTIYHICYASAWLSSQD